MPLLTNFNQRKNLFLILFSLVMGIIAFGARLYVNFSQELIPGVNGGYYPLQVRHILDTGFLGFDDMPLLFYLNAAILKFISFFGYELSDQLILNVVKLVDSLSVPLIVIPVYKILTKIKGQINGPLSWSIIAFSVFSISPLVLVSDLQKNALAILFLFLFIQKYFSYLIDNKRINLGVAILFLILTGLTHFGTFAFGLFISTVFIVFLKKWKAVIPILILSSFSMMLIFILDPERFYRLITFWNVIFEKPAFLVGQVPPHEFLNVLFSVILAIWGWSIAKTKSQFYQHYQGALNQTLAICLIACSFPVLDFDYFRRLSLFLFILQILMLIQISACLKRRSHNILSLIIILITLLSIAGFLGNQKRPVITQEAYDDLKNLNSSIDHLQGKSLIVARHGLEWWTAWATAKPVGQEKAVNQDDFREYQNIFILNQITGFIEERGSQNFPEPLIPEGSELIYKSDFFKVYRITGKK